MRFSASLCLTARVCERERANDCWWTCFYEEIRVTVQEEGR